MADENDFVFFYGGPFSQWAQCSLNINGVMYNCAEQYMMARKAMCFDDQEALKKIMATPLPWEQKALGRKVKNFDYEKWSKISRQVVYDANFAKFYPKEWRKILLDTGNKEIVEASPTDIIWGIGLAEDDPRRFDKSKWRGTNWLGEVLMKVREDLRAIGDE